MAGATHTVNPRVRALQDHVTGHYEGGALRTRALLGGTPTPDYPSGNDGSPASELASLAFPLAQDFRIRQDQGYIFDTLALRFDRRGGGLIQRFDGLAELTESADYFTAYCIARGIAPDGVGDLAERLLADTEPEYRRRYARIFCRAAAATHVTENEFDQALRTVTTSNPAAYPLQRILDDLHAIIDTLGCAGRISISVGSRSGLTTNVTTLEPRRAHIFIDDSVGLEAYRGSFHALGHSLFAVHPQTDYRAVLGVNIAATEVIAFQAQHFALGDEEEDNRQFISFLHLYHARLYAVRVLHERMRCTQREECRAEYEELAETHLGIAHLEPLPLRPKIVSVDFLLAFARYLAMGQLRADWSDLYARAGTVDNLGILRGEHCLADDVNGAS